MRRAAAGVAAVVALALPAVAHATAAHDAALARKGITLGVKKHWLKAADAQRYRADVTHALRDVSRLAPLRARVITSQLAQLTPLWSSYTSPRALTLFGQLEANMSYLETQRLPTTAVDITDDDGVVYRWFPNLGFEFHPLASFGALNSAAAAQDTGKTQALANALVARAIPRGSRLIWEYQFRFGSGRPPWASGLAQAVAAQALARSAALLDDPALGAAAVRAFASVSPLTLELSSGPWIRLYGFNSEIVLNAQLQAALSVLEYAQSTEDAKASVLAQQLTATAEKMLPRFDTGDWSLYELGGAYASKSYEKFVTDLLQKLAAKTGDPFWVATSQRFHAYYYDPPLVTQTTTPPTIYPQPADGYLDTAPISLTLNMRASVTLAVGGKVTTYRWAAGPHTVNWSPVGLAPGTYPVQITATSYAGHKATYSLAPIVVQFDTVAPAIAAQPTLSGSTLTWSFTDPGTPTVDLAVDFSDPAGVNPAQTVELGPLPLSGTATVAIPPGTWNATLRATNTAGLTTTVLLGTFIQPG
ncbi:MAG TPA: D-glucuronyl C5-epimerase family protein [Gaiellaceae bacterium]